MMVVEAQRLITWWHAVVAIAWSMQVRHAICSLPWASLDRGACIILRPRPVFDLFTYILSRSFHYSPCIIFPDVRVHASSLWLDALLRCWPHSGSLSTPNLLLCSLRNNPFPFNVDSLSLMKFAFDYVCLLVLIALGSASSRDHVDWRFGDSRSALVHRDLAKGFTYGLPKYIGQASTEFNSP